MTDSTGLTGDSAADSLCDNVELAVCLCSSEGLTNDELQCIETEVIVDVLTVDRDLSRTGYKADAGNGILTTACTVEINFVSFLCSHIAFSSRLLLECIYFGLLSLLIVLSSCIYMKFLKHLTAE